MWKKCVMCEKEYLIKHSVESNLHKLYITDLIRLWSEEIEEYILLQRCKDMNRLLETSDAELLKLIWSLVEGVGATVTELTDTVDGKQLELQCNLEDLLKFRIKFFLHLANPIQFFEEVSCSLLVTISELEKQQRLLIDIIKKKDLEIAEYKLEGAKISRGAVETQAFDPETFSRQCSEQLGTTKGVVRTQPISTFTPLVTELITKTQLATEIKPMKNDDEFKTLNTLKKKGPIKLKSPVKEKKIKMYLDDEEEDVCNQKEIKKVEERSSTEIIQKKNKQELKSLKRNLKPRLKKLLS